MSNKKCAEIVEAFMPTLMAKLRETYFDTEWSYEKTRTEEPSFESTNFIIGSDELDPVWFRFRIDDRQPVPDKIQGFFDRGPSKEDMSQWVDGMVWDRDSNILMEEFFECIEDSLNEDFPEFYGW